MRKVIITKTTEKKLQAIFEYLNENWPKKVTIDFIKKLDATIEIIQKNPESFPTSKKRKNLHKCVLTKHNILFYSFTSTKITIITVFDSRQHPKKLKL